MARYAVKIGELHLTSDKPITQEQRERAKLDLIDRDRGIVTVDGLYIVERLER